MRRKTRYTAERTSWWRRITIYSYLSLAYQRQKNTQQGRERVTHTERENEPRRKAEKRNLTSVRITSIYRGCRDMWLDRYEPTLWCVCLVGPLVRIGQKVPLNNVAERWLSYFYRIASLPIFHFLVVGYFWTYVEDILGTFRSAWRVLISHGDLRWSICTLKKRYFTELF